MRTNLLCLSFLVILLPSQIFAQSVLGKWKTIDDESGKAKSIVSIYKGEDGKVYGRIEKLLDLSQGEDPVCVKCPGDQKNKKVRGMIIIRGLNKSGNVWKGGKILDPENGKEYSCRIWLDDKNLKVRGYWGVFYRTQTWYPAS